MLDQFFTKVESQQLIDFVEESVFPDPIYGSPQGVLLGETPAKRLSEEKAQALLHTPIPSIEKLQGLFYLLGEQLNAYTFSLPKKTCIPNLTCTGNVASNYVVEVSEETMRSGFHKDYDPEEHPQYLLPKLYEPGYYPENFVNGSSQSPYLMTAMTYIHSPFFSPEKDGMGTIFQNKQKKNVYTIECQQGRIAFFEGNIQHSLQNSFTPPTDEKWRVSLVWLLCFFPKSKGGPSLQNRWKELMTQQS